MSHFYAFVLVEPDAEDIKAEVAKKLAPYNENKEVPEYKSFMDEEDVKRMTEFYKTNELEKLVTHMEDWSGHPGGIEEDRLYQLTTYNPMSKWDWYVIGGRWQGAIVGQDSCPECEKNPRHNYTDDHNTLVHNTRVVSELNVEDIQLPFAIVTPDGSWNERGRMGWFGTASDENPDWNCAAKKILEEHKDFLAVGCDLHI